MYVGWAERDFILSAFEQSSAEVDCFWNFSSLSWWGSLIPYEYDDGHRQQAESG